VNRVEVRKVGGELCQVICDKPATLVYLANQACIEMHTFLSKTSALDRPDQLVFDLDPPAEDRFGETAQLALRLRELLEDDLKLTAYVKTTGGKGLHVHVPLRASDGFDAVRRFARQASEVLAARNPDLLTTQQRRAGRGDRVYADVMRNAYAQTVVAPYSVRARPGAPVATPLRWEELADRDLTPQRFTLRSVGSRLERLGTSDPWAGLAPARLQPGTEPPGAWRRSRHAHGGSCRPDRTVGTVLPGGGLARVHHRADRGLDRLASIPAGACSCSAVWPSRAWCARRAWWIRGAWWPLANAASTASPRPPSGQWSSTVTKLPVASAAARSVCVSTGLTEYRSITRAAMPSAASESAAMSASWTVTPAAMMVTRSSPPERSTCCRRRERLAWWVRSPACRRGWSAGSRSRGRPPA
jgi:DNA ligase D-like protein (predicted polymerase)